MIEERPDGGEAAAAAIESEGRDGFERLVVVAGIRGENDDAFQLILAVLIADSNEAENLVHAIGLCGVPAIIEVLALAIAIDVNDVALGLRRWLWLDLLLRLALPRLCRIHLHTEKMSRDVKAKDTHRK